MVWFIKRLTKYCMATFVSFKHDHDHDDQHDHHHHHHLIGCASHAMIRISCCLMLLSCRRSVAMPFLINTFSSSSLLPSSSSYCHYLQNIVKFIIIIMIIIISQPANIKVWVHVAPQIIFQIRINFTIISIESYWARSRTLFQSNTIPLMNRIALTFQTVPICPTHRQHSQHIACSATCVSAFVEIRQQIQCKTQMARYPIFG